MQLNYQDLKKYMTIVYELEEEIMTKLYALKSTENKFSRYFTEY